VGGGREVVGVGGGGKGGEVGGGRRSGRAAEQMSGGRGGHAARNESSRGERAKAQLMDLHGVSPWPFLGRSTRGGGGHCFQIGDDRVDLGALEVMLEGGHWRGAPGD